MKNKSESSNKKTIVIIGCGFGGMKLAKKLKNSKFKIIIIDRNNYHQFAPLFYQIASSGLEPDAICFPLREEFRNVNNISFRYGEVISIDTSQKFVITQTNTIKYDILIISTGTGTNFFGNPNLKDYCYTMKSVSDALLLRNQILLSLEKACECNDTESRNRMLTFVVSGAGPSGVEISGAIGELKKYVIQREYKEIKDSEIRIILIEAADKILKVMNEKSGLKAAKSLEELDVEILFNTRIVDYDGRKLTTSSGDLIFTDTLIWTAGTEGDLIDGLCFSDYGNGHRLIVDEYNKLIKYEDIYAIGDCAIMITEGYPYGHPQVAQVAIQQAENLFFNLLNESHKKRFLYKDKGSMATIGRNRAVVNLKNNNFSGRIAWWMWLFVHLLTLVGIRNKIVTLVNWIWNYFTYNSSLRLIIKPEARSKREEPECEIKIPVERNSNKT